MSRHRLPLPHDAAAFGEPRILRTRAPGRPLARPAGPTGWAARCVRSLGRIHGRRMGNVTTKFEVHVQTPPVPDYASIRDAWQAAEDAGFDGIWSWDHFFTETIDDCYEGWTLLAALAE